MLSDVLTRTNHHKFCIQVVRDTVIGHRVLDRVLSKKVPTVPETYKNRIMGLISWHEISSQCVTTPECAIYVTS